jgi:hypothetical protein
MLTSRAAARYVILLTDLYVIFATTDQRSAAKASFPDISSVGLEEVSMQWMIEIFYEKYPERIGRTCYPYYLKPLEGWETLMLY